jgi:hypothetical protein
MVAVVLALAVAGCGETKSEGKVPKATAESKFRAVFVRKLAPYKGHHYVVGCEWKKDKEEWHCTGTAYAKQSLNNPVESDEFCTEYDGGVEGEKEATAGPPGGSLGEYGNRELHPNAKVCEEHQPGED